MGRHSPAVAELDRIEADRLRARALQLVARYEDHMNGDLTDLDRPGRMDPDAWLQWEGQAYVILKELARG